MASSLTISAPDHAIKSVTVFKSSKAEIVRTFALNLNAGQTKVVIKGLPSTIDTHAVRVSGLGDARLFDVVCTIGNDNDASHAPDSSPEIIRRLTVKKQALESEKRVREHEADLLANYAKTLTGEHVKPPQMSQFLESFIEQGRKNLDAVGEVSEKIIEIERQIGREATKNLLKKGDARGEVTIVLGTDESATIDLNLTYIVSNVQWKPTYELHATTENGKPSSSVTLHYRARITQITGEDWTNTSLTLSTVTSDTMVRRIPELAPIKIRPQPNPFHSNPFHANSSNTNQGGFSTQPHSIPRSRNELLRAAATGVEQQSQRSFAAQPQQQLLGLFGGGTAFGAAPSGGNLIGGSALAVQPQFQASFAAQSQTIPVSSTSSAFGAVPSAPPHPHTDAETASDEQDFEDITAPVTIMEPITIVTETPIAISYSVHGETTIPSDGIEHQVSVAVLPFEANVSYVAIPRIEPRVYLQCHVKNTSEYRLLPGPVGVILDDSYVSRTFISDVNTGDTFDCTLGDDVATKVTYLRTSRSAKVDGGSFSEAMKTVTYSTQITIHNKHAFTIPDLVMCDIIPTCDDKRAKVILRKPEGLADAKAGEVVKDSERDGLKIMWSKQVEGMGGEKEGKFEWRWSVAAGAKVTLESQWEIKAPADIIWAEMAA